MLRRTFLAAGLLALAAAACRGGEAKRPDGGEGLLPVGAAAPDVVARDPRGHEVRLSSLRGRPVVVYFYPKDGTPGCTKEACAFRDAWDKYQQAGVEIIGVSRDDEESHRAFVAKHKLPFALASDPAGDVERAYGVPNTMGLSKRVSFLVDGDGKIARVWPDVDPGVHADEVLSVAVPLKK